MGSISAAISAVWAVLVWLFAAILSGILLFEGWLHVQLSVIGVPRNVQTLLLIAAAVVLVVLALRIFGGIFRILLLVLLILFALHLAFPLIHTVRV